MERERDAAAIISGIKEIAAISKGIETVGTGHNAESPRVLFCLCVGGLYV